MKVLLVIDMQNDFITGALGTPEAEAVVEPLCKLIREFDGGIVYTRDTHFENYLETQEGRNLPVIHCVEGSSGWEICEAVKACMKETDLVVNKLTFGAFMLPEALREWMGGAEPEEIHLAGLCTDICIISNAMICKAAFMETPVVVHKECCAGATPEGHEIALAAMKACQIEIV